MEPDEKALDYAVERRRRIERDEDFKTLLVVCEDNARDIPDTSGERYVLGLGPEGPARGILVESIQPQVVSCAVRAVRANARCWPEDGEGPEVKTDGGCPQASRVSRSEAAAKFGLIVR